MIIPTPTHFSKDYAKTIDLKDSNYNTIYSNIDSEPQIKIFIDGLKILIRMDFSYVKADGNEIIDKNFQILLDNQLESNQYKINITDRIIISAGSIKAAQWAMISFLQLLPCDEKTNQHIILPYCEITDQPHFPYIGLLIDLARKWHPVSVIKEIIVLCHWYKISYLHLHFTDDQSFTLPIKSFPKLASKSRHYTLKEINELNTFALERGVTIIPEIDLPGHSAAIVQKYPKIFGVRPFFLGKPKANIVNIGKEETYQALDLIIKEVIEMFPQSPYFHLGADEVHFPHLDKDKDIKESCKTHNFTDTQELYRFFIVRMNEIVKKYGKQMCVWEGFRADGKVEIPKDIPVFVFESLYNTADKLVADGYHVVNTSWQPIYVTPRKNWTPEEIYAWNPLRWENWFEKSIAYQHPIELPTTKNVMGAQLCSWEQPAEDEIPSLRLRVAVFCEKVWNWKNATTFEDFQQHLLKQDKKFEVLRNHIKKI